MAKDLLWEIGTEEIPARFMEPALKQLGDLASNALKENRLSYADLLVYGTPRRLALLVSGLAEAQEDLNQEVRGPAQKAAFDENGNPTKALQGFCRGQGVDVQGVTIKEVNSVPYCFVQKSSKGEKTASILPQILVHITQKLYFPKPMRWAYEEMRFARPIRWLIALYGKDILPITLGGITAGNTTRGHRFLSHGDIVITEAKEYVAKLAEQYVIVEQEQRKTMIWQQIQEKAKSLAGEVKEDGELLEEITYLVEYPTALVGKIEDRYLSLPPELIITPMREHQRYFPVYDKDSKLLPFFITVRNGLADHLDIVAEGNEKVLRARLDDAAFFWQEDLKKSLDDNVQKLQNVVFHESLGSIYDKVTRIQKIAAWLAAELKITDSETIKDITRAAFLAKADLVSNAVYEFTELQGIMGYYYALQAGEKKDVAEAIRDHYRPRFAGDDLPVNIAGQLVAIADKLDSLCGLFSVGLIPTGSQDPYALRRQAMGITQIILANGFHLSIAKMASFSYDLLAEKNQLQMSKEELQRNISAFFAQRLENVLSEKGISYDTIKAVMAFGIDDILTIWQKAVALQAFRQKDGLQELLAGFTRAANLAKNATEMIVEPTLFTDKAENDLYDSYQKAQEIAATAQQKEDYEKILDAVSSLRNDIDAFFTAVMVMDKEEKIKNNRLALLKQITLLAYQVGDLSLLVV